MAQGYAREAAIVSSPHYSTSYRQCLARRGVSTLGLRKSCQELGKGPISPPSGAKPRRQPAQSTFRVALINVDCATCTHNFLGRPLQQERSTASTFDRAATKGHCATALSADGLPYGNSYNGSLAFAVSD